LKALSIIGIIFGPLATFLSFIWIFIVQNLLLLRQNMFYQDVVIQRQLEQSLENSGLAIGRISIFLMLFYIALFVVSLIQLKNNTVKSIGVIGIVISLIMLCWNIVMMLSPSVITFDEVGFAWVLYFLMCLSFSIVLLVQRNRHSLKPKKPKTQNVLDDFEFE
jgi:hypothetical protein